MSRDGELNVIEFLRRAAERVPDRPALIFGGGDGEGQQLTFAELWERAARIAAGLASAGLVPGERAIVMIPMSAELYAALLGLLRGGYVAVFVDPWIGWRQIAAFSAFAEPRAWVGVTRSHLLRVLDRRIRRIALTVTTGRRLGHWPAARTLAELEAATGRCRVDPATADHPALITFTSGSSGSPKGANRTHGFLTAQHLALRREFPYDDDDVDMAMFPVFALNNLALGITTVVPEMDFRRVDAVDASQVLGQMERFGVTTCTASPPFFDRLVQYRGGRIPPGLRLRRILTGGAPVSDAQLRAWQRAFPRTEIEVVYGSTEAEPVAHLRAAERLAATNDLRPRAPGYCVGRITEQLRARIIAIDRRPVSLGDEGWPAREVPPHAIGELVVSGDHVCRDYYRNPEAGRENKIVEPDGTVWHRMGDTGYLDRDGRFWLVGRVHSTIFRHGEAIHPQLVEQAAGGEDPRIRRAAAVGLPDRELGERVVVVLETDAGAELRAEVTARLQEAEQTVDEIVLSAEALPLDPRHRSKIDYQRLRRRLNPDATPEPS
ncbi:MAG: AMP-binding protein [bacterium]|nr:AMP-binding protein [bacterium]